MTIFKKMLLAPILSLLIYSCFSVYSYSEYQKNSAILDIIQNSFGPAAILITETNIQLTELIDLLKDSVLAGESDWLVQASKTRDEIDKKLSELKQYKQIIHQDKLERLQKHFTLYYKSTVAFSNQMLKDQDAISTASELIADIEYNLNSTQSILDELTFNIEDYFFITLSESRASLESQLIYSMVIFLVTMTVTILVMLVMAVSTRQSLDDLTDSIKKMTTGKSNFSQRIFRKQKDELGTLIYWFNRLADKLELDYKKLKTISITDPLTQLNNRTRTDTFFPTAIQSARFNKQPLTLVIIDIDHFKSVNDNFGHLTGDKVLQAMADILKKSARQHDFVARWGGEEFIIILSNTELEDAFEHTESIRKKVENHQFPEIGSITSSFGISKLNETDTAESIMARADKCLYKAKELGRNRVITESDLTS